jgi:formiminotetrahydrofolate cyclodeaminase
MTSLSELSLARFVQAVGEDRPSPGCGGAAAVSLALAAACARKAFGISARRHGGEAELEAAAERCRVLSEAAIVGVQRDAANFETLLKTHGADEPALALEGDAQVLIAMAAELRALVERHAHAIDAHLVGDAAAALALTEAFERIETRNLLDT